ncbi:MAG: hypothetical protein MR487_09965 [Lachnospiraceae bacterium]|nr:hypothetical protein [Lachnospiraceae bacterium]
MSEIKPRSLRMSEENYGRLQTLSDGRSMDDTISFLLASFDRQEERNGLGTQAVKLDELDEYLNAVRSQFSALLHNCQNARELARDDFRRELNDRNLEIEKLKDEVLKLQREQIRKDSNAQETIDELKRKLEIQKDTSAALQKQLDETAAGSAAGQQAIASLSTALSAAEKKASLLDSCQIELEGLQNQLKDAQTHNEEQRKSIMELQQSLQILQKKDAQWEEKYHAEIARLQEELNRRSEEQMQEHSRELQHLTKEYEQKIQWMQSEQELIRKEAQIKAQEEINAIRESYQNKLYQMMIEEKKKAE